MRKSAKYVIIALLGFFFTTNVKAEQCDYAKQVELNNLASTVKATYEKTEIKTGETESYVDEDGVIDESIQVPVVEKGFNLKILNLTQQLYVIVKDDSGNEKTYYYDDSKNGTISIGNVAADRIRAYSFNVRGLGGGCSGYDLRTFNLLLPKYNYYSELQICKNKSDLEICQEYLSSDKEITADQIIDATLNDTKKETEKVEKKEKQSVKDQIISFIKNNIIIFSIVIGAIIIAGGIAIYLAIKKRWKRII